MEEENVDLILEQAKEKSNKIFDIFDKYDTKATILIAVIGLILTVIPKNKVLIHLCIVIKNSYVIQTPLDLTYFGYIFLLLGIFFVFLSFKIVNVHFPPNLKMLQERYLEEKTLFTKRRLIAIFIQAVEKNTIVIYSKARFFKYGFGFTSLALVYFLILKLFS